jgi:membrane-associated phospholipid phosphatase
LAALVLFLLLAHALAWSVRLALGAAVQRLPVLARTRAWARVRPLQASLRLRHPRAFAALAARLSSEHFSGLPLTLIVVGALYLAGLFGGLTEQVMEEADAVLRFDQAINAHFAVLRVPPLVRIFQWVTVLGTGPALTAVSITASLFLWADGRRGYVLPLWVTFLGAQATTWSGKYLVDRHRPTFLPGLTEASPSFPSSHATASMAVFGFLAYALARDRPDPRQRFEIGFWAAMLILLIGFSRVFLSLHFTTDVLAGFMVGSFWLLVGLAVREGTARSCGPR